MHKNYFLNKIYLLSICICSISCKENILSINNVAYFGGEIENAKSNMVFFLKGDKVLDTFYLDKNNRFFHKFDSLTPGLYSFRHEPEYQYVYFEKNDSIMFKLNTNDFDNSLMFCGRGDEKNNFLMEVYLKDLTIENELFDLFEKNTITFNSYLNTKQKEINKLYYKRKKFIKWSDEFDNLAKNNIMLNYASKKEIFPIAHELKTGKAIKNKLPKDYYEYRKHIDVNNSSLLFFNPFVNYITAMLNNIVLTSSKGVLDDMSLENNIKKLQCANTLIKDKHVKNLVINYIANMYLLSDQCSINNDKFFKLYSSLATDEKQKSEVMAAANSIKKLNQNNKLPNITLVDIDGNKKEIKSLINKKTIIYFWTKQSNSHAILSHEKVKEFKQKYPNIQFIAVNIKNNHADWLAEIKTNKFENSFEFRAENFEVLKENLFINKIHRTIIVNADGTIDNAFVCLFDDNFETCLHKN